MHPIRLLHLPKTAGTTVASSLLKKLGRKNKFVFSSNPRESRERYDALTESEKQAIRVFIGHSLFYTGVPAADHATIITYLREPISRVKSYITHVAEGRSMYKTEEGRPSSELSVDELLESGNPELDNLQTKALINRDEVASSSGIQSLGETAAVELAKKNLFEGCTAFGLQDRFDEGWIAIWSALNIKPPVFATMNQKRGTRRVEFTPEHIERIREMNELDIALYKAACLEFDRRVAEGAVPATLLADFQRRQARYGPILGTVWNHTRNTYYAFNRTKRRILGR